MTTLTPQQIAAQVLEERNIEPGDFWTLGYDEYRELLVIAAERARA